MERITRYLLEEPQKLERLLWYIYEKFFSILLAIFFYSLCVDEKDFDVKKFDTWLNFVIHGKFLLVIVLLYISDHLIYSLLKSIIIWIFVRPLAAKLSKELLPGIQVIDVVTDKLAKFDVVKHSTNNRRVYPSTYFENFREMFVEEFTSKGDSSSGSNKSRVFFIYDHFYYVILSLVSIGYFYNQYGEISGWIIGFLVILLIVFYLLSIISWLIIKFLNDNKVIITKVLNALSEELKILEELKAYFAIPESTTEHNKRHFGRVVKFNRKEFYLEIHSNKYPILGKRFMEEYYELACKHNKKLLLITKGQIEREAIEFINEKSDTFLVLKYESLDQIPELIAKCHR